MTSSAIVLPLLGASGATAAEAATWDRLAECESGGAWSANDANGFYGGLQLTQEAWEKHGGLTYAVSPDQASRSQQITVGERILAAQGPAAWPGCGEAVGLVKGGPAAAVDPGVPSKSDKGNKGSAVIDTAPGGVAAGKSDASRSTADRPASQTPRPVETTEPGSSTSPSASEGASGSAAPSDGATSPDATGSSGPSDSADPSGSSSSSPSSEASPGESSSSSDPGDGTPGTGTGSESGRPGSSSPSPGASDATTGASTGTEAKDGSGRHRGAPAAEEAVASREGDSAAEHASRSSASRDELDKSYTVQSGDNLSAIADSQGVEGGWSTLYDGNKGTVGTDPDLILPGQSLDLAPEAPEKKQ
ncbi:transglycosylase family protein [Streptomyces sp. NPDC059578]|uniref:transglycosylase family protein n=1 Tax=Streptomyces sp. NPDC059578 TaxID=3346874 RepID=UPI0036C77AF6